MNPRKRWWLLAGVGATAVVLVAVLATSEEPASTVGDAPAAPLQVGQAGTFFGPLPAQTQGQSAAAPLPPPTEAQSEVDRL